MKIAIKRILVPIDFTEGSDAAVSYAAALVEELGASLHVLHVLEELAPADATLPFPARKNVEREVEGRAWRDLGLVLSPKDQMRLRTVLALEWGTPFVEIIRYAKTHSIDLIVLGSHQQGSVREMLLGEVVTHVVHGAPCPVLTVRAPERHAAAVEAGARGT
jgi:nucleotide-binding universal stress UspA family protein